MELHELCMSHCGRQIDTDKRSLVYSSNLEGGDQLGVLINVQLEL